MANAAERLLIARFTAQTRELTQGLRTVTGAIGGLPKSTEQANKGIGRAMARAGKSIVSGVADASAVAATSVLAIGGAAIKAGKDYNVLMQRSRAAMTSILGGEAAADKMLAKIKQLASQSPFPRQAFVEASQRMLAFGIRAEEVIPILGAVQDAVAAAGGSAADIEGITTVLAKIRSAGKITAEDFNQLGDRGINAAELIAKGMGTTAGEIRTQVSKGAIDANKALSTLVDQMGVKYKGAADNLKGTWIGAVDRIKGAMRDLGSILVAPFIDPKGGGYATTWANKIADLFRMIEKVAGPAIENSLGRLGPIFDRVSPLFDRVTAMIGSVGKGQPSPLLEQLKSLAPVIAPITAGLVALGGANIAGVLGPLAGLVPTLNPVLVAIGALILAMPELRDTMKALLPIILAFGQELGGILGDALREIMPIIAQLGDVIGLILRGAMVTLLPVILNVVKALTPFLPLVARLVLMVLQLAQRALVPLLPLITRLADFFGVLLQPILMLVGVLIDALMPVFEALMPVISEVVGILGDSLVEILPPIIELASILAQALVPILKALSPLLVVVAKIIGQLLTSALKILLPMISDLIKAFVWLAGKIYPIVSGLITGIVDLFTWLFNVLVGHSIIPDLVKSIFSLFSTMITKLVGAIRWLVNTVVGFFVGLRDKVIGLILALANAVIARVSILRDRVLGVFRALRDLAVLVWTQLRDWSVAKFNSLTSSVSGAALGLRDKVLGAFRSLRDQTKAIFSTIGKGVGSAFGTVEAKVKGVLRSLFDFLNRYMIEPLNSVGSKFGLKIPALPKLHSGGPVPGRGERNYTLLGGEGVLNRRAMRRVGGTRGLADLNRGREARTSSRGDKGRGGFWTNPIAAVKGWVADSIKTMIEKVMGPIVDSLRDMGTDVPWLGDLMRGAVGIIRDNLITFGAAKDEAAAAAASIAGGITPFELTGADSRRVTYKGKSFTALFAAGLSKAQQLAGSGMSIFQGGFRPATSYSGTSHRGDAIDLQVSMGLIRALRRVGIPAWDRTGLGNWAPHVHAVPLPGAGFAAGSAIWQAQDYLRGGNGLGGRDNGPRVKADAWVKGSKYDSGGWLPPGISVAVNRTGRPEAVFTAAQLAVLEGAGKTEIHVHGALDADAVARQIQTLLSNASRRRSGVTVRRRADTAGMLA